MSGIKILIYFSSHRQLKEIEYSSYFYNKTEFLKNNSDVMIHIDNDLFKNDDVLEYTKYDTNCYIARSKQTYPVYPNGVFNGFLKGLSNNFEFFKNYDYVIHLVPDCYITNEDKIVELLNDNINSEFDFIVDYHPHHNQSTISQYTCDFFVFKPKKIPNIFSDHSDINVVVAENWLYSKIHEYNIKHKTICRGQESLRWNIDDYGLIHNHNLKRIESILSGYDDRNLIHK